MSLETKHKKWKLSEILVTLMMALYVGWFSFLSIRQHHAFMTGLDLGNIDQALWSTSYSGQFLRMTTLEGQYSPLGGHVEPVLLLLVPLYWAAPDPRTLLIIQTVVLAGGAWAAYRLGRWKLGAAAGVVIAVVYLMAPIVQGANLFQFHAVAFKSWWRRGQNPPPGHAPGVALVDLGCRRLVEEQWSRLPTVRWYEPSNWSPEAIIHDEVMLPLPPEIPADCLGIQLGIVDSDEQPLRVDRIKLTSTSRQDVVVEENRLILPLVPKE